MEYFAHKTQDGRKQTVKAHLYGTAELAEKNSVELLKPLAHAAGMVHDIGKYSQDFQDRLDGKSIRFEHSSCGAIEYSKSKYFPMLSFMLQYCIAGHHTGLPDGGTNSDSPENDVTLSARLRRDKNYKGSADYTAYKNEIELEFPVCKELVAEIANERNKYDGIEKYAFFIRYLFSCLTDADYLDTERFYSPEIKRGLIADIDNVCHSLDEKFRSFVYETELQKARCRLQEQAYKNAEKSGNISILNMPTGSGKTLCSLKIALNKLKADPSKKRIIYVIPYTSIIEQTADRFEEMFGQYAEILQHHSNYSFDENKEETTAEKLKRAAENWDAPIIITTSVQFFESLYHYKGSSLRKLHNTADSIIIFDEIHLLPIEMLQPCLRGIGYITKYLNSEAIFLSATMPDFGELFKRYLPDCTVTELMTDKADFAYFKKCRYSLLGKTDIESIAEKAAEYRSSLIVVNKRRTAREVYNSISGRKYHLSTYMTPRDRTETIAAIRSDLSRGEQMTVVSTSLIEAGVDLDFKSVFREMAGLDNILQSGGRCNREGRDESGDVFVFETEEGVSRDMEYVVDIVRGLFGKYADITSPECIAEYYRSLYKADDDVISANYISNVKISGLAETGPKNIPFRTYAENFKFIKEGSVGVVINNCSEAAELYEKLRAGVVNVRRSLQKYTVSLKRYEFETAMKLGIIDDYGTGVFELTNLGYYSPETGLELDRSFDMII